MSLVAKDIYLTYNGHPVLLRVSCEIRPGELTVIIGPNGSGKTSLLKVLAGELQPGGGSVRLDGRLLGQWPVADLARRRAVMPQHARLDFPFRVREVVALGRSPWPRDREKDRRLVDEAIDCFDIGPFAERMYTTLSGGERQRVHLARVWAQLSEPQMEDTRYLLLDEPGSALDLAHQRELLIRLRDAVSGGRLGVLAAIHNLDSAARYADQILLLDEGTLVAQGTRDEVMTVENIEKTYRLPIKFLYYKPGEPYVLAMPEPGEES